MKIDHITTNRRTLLEGGNLAIRGHEAQHLDLKVTDRSYMVPRLNQLLSAINNEYQKEFKEPLWDPQILKSGNFLSGSSLHFFNVSGIPDNTFVAKKPTVGDIDTMVDKTKEQNLQQFLSAREDKLVGPATLRGFQRGNEQFSALWEMQDPPVKVQIDFEFVAYEKGKPTDWARFSHSSSWDDLQAGIKGVFHKWLIQAFTALTRKQFLLRKMVGRGKLRKEEDVPTTDNMFSFAVSSKEGGGLRAKYEPVIENGKPLVKDGLPVMTAAPAAGYDQNIESIFAKVLGRRMDPNKAAQLSKNFWSFTGLLTVMNTVMTPEDKQQVLTGFLEKTIGPGAQGMYKNNPDRDIKEKLVAIDTLLKTLKLPRPATFEQMLQAYRNSYSMTPDQPTGTNDTVKAMAKNALDEAGEKPNYKRQGIQHIYNPGSTVEIKDIEFIELCKELAQNGGKLDNVPISLKVDGAGIRFGKDQQGKPFFMTSKVTEPKYIENYGDFEAFGKSRGQDEARLQFTRNYDEALKLIVTSKFIKDLPDDTIVQAEMLYNPMAQKTTDGYQFVNISYDPKKLGKIMTLVPFSVKQYSTGEQRPDAAQIKKQLLADSTDQLKLVNCNLSQSHIDVSKIIAPVVKNADALVSVLKTRGESPQKTKAKEVITAAKKSLSDAIIESPIPGKDVIGANIEGLVVAMPSGRLVKVTSTAMKEKMAAKMAANKKPTTGGNRVKPAVVTIGSFVGHKGHQVLINKTINDAKQVGGDPYIYVSPVMGADDPISPELKVQTLQRLYPEYANNIKVWDPNGTPMKKIEKELVLPANSPYNKIILLVGSDRYASMKDWMTHLEKRMKDPVALAKYGGTQDQVEFETIEVPRGAVKGGIDMSFTQLRNVLKDPNKSEQEKLAVWMQGFDSTKLGQAWIEHLMKTTEKNMGITVNESIKAYIAKIKPLIKEASPEQKEKIYKLLSEAKKKMSAEKDEPAGQKTTGFLSPEFDETLKFAEIHYPGAKSKEEAFVMFVLRSLKHSKEDSVRHDKEISELMNRVARLSTCGEERILATPDKPEQNNSISEDYMSEK